MYQMVKHATKHNHVFNLASPKQIFLRRSKCLQHARQTYVMQLQVPDGPSSRSNEHNSCSRRTPCSCSSWTMKSNATHSWPEAPHPTESGGAPCRHDTHGRTPASNTSQTHDFGFSPTHLPTKRHACPLGHSSLDLCICRAQ